MHQIPLSLLGHRDHGKSTLIGKLLMETDSVPKERVEHAEALSKELSTRFEYAFLMDSFREERAEGLTLDTTSAKLKYDGVAFEMIDVPGHKTLIKNMLTGASRAQYALLVVSAKTGEGFQEETRLHLMLAKMLGLEKIIACVTKMDLVNYDRGVFDRIRHDVGGFLAFAGFNPKNATWIPVSSMDGANISKPSKHLGWYSGPALLPLIRYTFSRPVELSHLPARFLVQDSLAVDGKTLYVGQVKQGQFSIHDRVDFAPQNARGELVSFGTGKTKLVAGQNDGLNLSFETDARPARGSIGALASAPVKTQRKFSSTLFVLPGFCVDFEQPLEIQNASATVQGTFSPDATLDVHRAEKNPPHSFAAEMTFHQGTFVLQTPLAVEPFDQTPFLGRFVLRQNGVIAAVGVVREVFS